MLDKVCSSTVGRLIGIGRTSKADVPIFSTCIAVVLLPDVGVQRSLVRVLFMAQLALEMMVLVLHRATSAVLMTLSGGLQSS